MSALIRNNESGGFMKAVLILISSWICLTGSLTFANESSGQYVGSVAPGSTYEKLGLLKGDRILSYDGKNVNSPTEAMDLYNGLKSGTVKAVVVERNGKKQTLNYKIQ
jgi:S1-C subfamily serine protease